MSSSINQSLVNNSLTYYVSVLFLHLTPSNVSSGTNYTVSTLTGNVEGAETDANVYITLYGEKGDSGFRKLETKRFTRAK